LFVDYIEVSRFEIIDLVRILLKIRYTISRIAIFLDPAHNVGTGMTSWRCKITKLNNNSAILEYISECGVGTTSYRKVVPSITNIWRQVTAFAVSMYDVIVVNSLFRGRCRSLLTPSPGGFLF
jgi:hypothetical protein